MTLLHSHVNGLKIKNRCHQKEDVTLTPYYIKDHMPMDCTCGMSSYEV